MRERESEKTGNMEAAGARLPDWRRTDSERMSDSVKKGIRVRKPTLI